jgi:Tol biopolymer transport system component
MRHRRVFPVVTIVGTLLLAAAVAAMPRRAAAAFPGGNGRLVFSREMPAGDHTQSDLYTVRPAGTHLRRLTATPNRNEFGAQWDATGTRIVLWRTPAPFGPGTVWVMDADGGAARALTHGMDARDPAWSPSGRSLVFTRADGDFDLWTMRSDGSGLHRFTRGPALDFEPAWSPDGRSIAFTRGSQQGDAGDIWVKDVTSGALRRMTRSPAYDHQVAWGPAGHRLLFERDLTGSSSIFAVGLTAGTVVRLTSGPSFDTGPAPSPDGRLVAFGTDRGASLGDLWVMRADGTARHRLLDLPYGEAFPDWRPLRPAG